MVLAWKQPPLGGDQWTLSAFSLAGGGAVQVAWRRYEAGRVAAETQRLAAAGFRVGAYNDDADFVWVLGEGEVAVWSEREVVLAVDGDRIRTQGGTHYHRHSIIRMALFVSPDRLDRGLRAELSDGCWVDLVVERRWSGMTRPLYGFDELEEQLAWLWEVGPAVAVWAEVMLDDHTG